MENTPNFHASISVTNDVEKELGEIISRYPKDKLFLITEDKCEEICLPLISKTPEFERFKITSIPSGEENKNLSSVEKIWTFLSRNGADRKSLTVNLGGGMLTDLGSFAASTFKRGMDFVNIPTTLLSQVDASVGGKTGFNFNGLKNEIGVINQPKEVLIDTRFLASMSRENLLSGYAEMIKHGLIQSEEHLREVREFRIDNPDLNRLGEIIARSVAIKDEIVFKDPNERNIRKALNFGHTAGHAFESFSHAIEMPVLHGYAVAYGMIAELYLSQLKCNFPLEKMNELSSWLLSLYGKFEIKKSDSEELYELMTHDKKNEEERINFTLLPGTGSFVINQNCRKDEIFEALEYYRNLN